MLRLAQSSEEGEGAQKAAKAVADGKKVAILFQNPDGLDDRAMRGVMRQLDARTRTVVLTDDVDAVDRYGSMVEDLGVSQTPAVVLIDRKGEARLIEGYVDTDTLAQAVADAR
jgi:protein-disulfide isomerase